MLSSRPLPIHNNCPAGGLATPARGLLAQRAARAANAGAGARTGGKRAAAYQTPLKGGPGLQAPLKTPAPRTGAKGGKLILTEKKVLGDKTPFPNRKERDSLAALLATPAMLPAADTELPGLSPRPSAGRASIRRRASGSLGAAGGGLSFQGMQFETPRVNGNPWDVSDFDIAIPEADAIQEEVVEEDDFDEIEYCPPRPAGTYISRMQRCIL
jgi:hypothetical protein